MLECKRRRLNGSGNVLKQEKVTPNLMLHHPPKKRNHPQPLIWPLSGRRLLLHCRCAKFYKVMKSHSSSAQLPIFPRRINDLATFEHFPLIFPPRRKFRGLLAGAVELRLNNKAVKNVHRLQGDFLVLATPFELVAPWLLWSTCSLRSAICATPSTLSSKLQWQVPSSGTRNRRQSGALSTDLLKRAAWELLLNNP